LASSRNGATDQRHDCARVVQLID
jgi:hypothetical protein